MLKGACELESSVTWEGATGMGDENCYLADSTICFGGPQN